MANACDRGVEAPGIAEELLIMLILTAPAVNRRRGCSEANP